MEKDIKKNQADKELKEREKEEEERRQETGETMASLRKKKEWCDNAATLGVLKSAFQMN